MNTPINPSELIGCIGRKDDIALEYGVLPSSGYGVLDVISFVVFGEMQAQIRRIFLDGYDVLVVRTENIDYQSSERLYSLSFLQHLKLHFFEYEHVVVNSTGQGLDTATIEKPVSLGRIQKNLLDRVSQLY
ncbi:hypothetical protein Tco_1420206 [Tanacetum coccineum]